MNKNLMIGAAVVLVIAIAAVVAFMNKNRNAPDENATRPVIQITVGQAYLLNENGDRSKELASGEALTPPATIQVAEGGSARVSFPDGSVARMQSGTIFTLKSAEYNPATGRANASIFLKIGRVWSKVMELATPESTWEVETQAAVATVRGTAFDTNVTADATVFAGSEREVKIAPVDPATRARLDAEAQTMGEGKMITAGTTKLVVAELSLAEKESAWFTGNQSEDASINNIIEELRSRGLSGVELQNEMRARLRKSGEKQSSGGGEAMQNGRGTLIDLWKSGKNQKCTFSFDYGQGTSQGTVYLAGGRMRGDFAVTAAAGTAGTVAMETHMIRENDFTYVWTSESPQGFKMQTTGDMPGNLGNQSFDYNQMLDYTCTNWAGGDATFALPTGITFTSFAIPTQP